MCCNYGLLYTIGLHYSIHKGSFRIAASVKQNQSLTKFTISVNNG